MVVQLTRREVLTLLGAGSVAACAPSSGDAASTTTALLPRGSLVAPLRGLTVADLPAYEPSPQFPEGILSGSPTADSVVVWTRPSAELVESGEELTVELALDAAFTQIAATRSARPSVEVEGATHFDVDGLDPGTAYVYRFRIADAVSPVGLTRTAPAADADVAEVRVAVFSCQRWTHGYYNAHDDLAAQAPDLVICLGDYVYETGYADGVEVDGRHDPIQDATSLEEFRRKYELYRSDVALQRAHAVAPLVCIPDNHDGSHHVDDEKYPGAHEAFFEKMPVRRDQDDPLRTHAHFTWGRLLDLWLLDLERFRTREDRGSGNTRGDLVMMDEDATYLGDEQRAWLFDGLAATGAVWQVLGSARQFSPLRGAAFPDDDVLNAGIYLNLSQWDGYQAERLRVLDEVQRLGRTGTVVVSGDMHWFWAAEMPRDVNDPDAPPILSEFLCGGISSSNADERIAGDGPATPMLLESFAEPNQTYTRFFDGDRHGYGLLTFRMDGAEVEFRSPTTILEPGAPSEVVARMRLDPLVPGFELVEPANFPPVS